MGAITGQMTNIDEAGATSMFFHAYPWVMDFDPHSGDCASRGLRFPALSVLSRLAAQG